MAWRLFAAFGLVALVAGAFSFRAGGELLLFPLLFVFPFAVAHLFLEVNGEGRSLWGEVCGVIAMSSTAALIAVSGGWSVMAAEALGVLMILRSVPTILYVRTRLRLEKGKDAAVGAVIIVHIVSLAAVVAMAATNSLPVLATLPYAVLLIRGVIGVSELRRPAKAKAIGIAELLYGSATVIVLIIAYHW
jgi:hypothetical protein